MGDLIHDRIDWAAGLTVETQVTAVDPAGLGICITEMNSVDQAKFLVGLVAGFSRWDTEFARTQGLTLTRDMQLAYIGQAFDEDRTVGKPVAELLRRLADFIDEEAS